MPWRAKTAREKRRPSHERPAFYGGRSIEEPNYQFSGRLYPTKQPEKAKYLKGNVRYIHNRDGTMKIERATASTRRDARVGAAALSAGGRESPIKNCMPHPPAAPNPQSPEAGRFKARRPRNRREKGLDAIRRVGELAEKYALAAPPPEAPSGSSTHRTRQVPARQADPAALAQGTYVMPKASREPMFLGSPYRPFPDERSKKGVDLQEQLAKDLMSIEAHLEQRREAEAKVHQEGPDTNPLTDTEISQLWEKVTVLLNTLATRLLQEKNYDGCMELLKKAENLTEKRSYIPFKRRLSMRGVTLNNMACYFQRRNKPHIAVNYVERALNVEAKIAEPNNPAGTMLNMGVILLHLAQLEPALANFRAAAYTLLQEMTAMTIGENTKVSRVTNIYKMLCASYYNMGVVFESRQRYSEALESYRKSFSISLQSFSEDSEVVKRVQTAVDELSEKLGTGGIGHIGSPVGVSGKARPKSARIRAAPSSIEEAAGQQERIEATERPTTQKKPVRPSTAPSKRGVRRPGAGSGENAAAFVEESPSGLRGKSTKEFRGDVFTKIRGELQKFNDKTEAVRKTSRRAGTREAEHVVAYEALRESGLHPRKEGRLPSPRRPTSPTSHSPYRKNTSPVSIGHDLQVSKNKDYVSELNFENMEKDEAGEWETCIEGGWEAFAMAAGLDDNEISLVKRHSAKVITEKSPAKSSKKRSELEKINAIQPREGLEAEKAKLAEIGRRMRLNLTDLGQFLLAFKKESKGYAMNRFEFVGFVADHLREMLGCNSRHIDNLFFDALDMDLNESVDIGEFSVTLVVLCVGDIWQRIQVAFRTYVDTDDGCLPVPAIPKFLTALANGLKLINILMDNFRLIYGHEDIVCEELLQEVLNTGLQWKEIAGVFRCVNSSHDALCDYQEQSLMREYGMAPSPKRSNDRRRRNDRILQMDGDIQKIIGKSDLVFPREVPAPSKATLPKATDKQFLNLVSKATGVAEEPKLDFVLFEQERKYIGKIGDAAVEVFKKEYEDKPQLALSYVEFESLVFRTPAIRLYIEKLDELIRRIWPNLEAMSKERHRGVTLTNAGLMREAISLNYVYEGDEHDQGSNATLSCSEDPMSSDDEAARVPRRQAHPWSMRMNAEAGYNVAPDDVDYFSVNDEELFSVQSEAKKVATRCMEKLICEHEEAEMKAREYLNEATEMFPEKWGLLGMAPPSQIIPQDSMMSFASSAPETDPLASAYAQAGLHQRQFRTRTLTENNQPDKDRFLSELKMVAPVNDISKSQSELEPLSSPAIKPVEDKSGPRHRGSLNEIRENTLEESSTSAGIISESLVAESVIAPGSSDIRARQTMTGPAHELAAAQAGVKAGEVLTPGAQDIRARQTMTGPAHELAAAQAGVKAGEVLTPGAQDIRARQVMTGPIHRILYDENRSNTNSGSSLQQNAEHYFEPIDPPQGNRLVEEVAAESVIAPGSSDIRARQTMTGPAHELAAAQAGVKAGEVLTPGAQDIRARQVMTGPTHEIPNNAGVPNPGDRVPSSENDVMNTLGGSRLPSNITGIGEAAVVAESVIAPGSSDIRARQTMTGPAHELAAAQAGVKAGEVLTPGAQDIRARQTMTGPVADIQSK